MVMMSDSQKMNMMLGLLMKIQKDQEDLDREVTDVKENHKTLTMALRERIDGNSLQYANSSEQENKTVRDEYRSI